MPHFISRQLFQVGYTVYEVLKSIKPAGTRHERCESFPHTARLIPVQSHRPKVKLPNSLFATHALDDNQCVLEEVLGQPLPEEMQRIGIVKLVSGNTCPVGRKPDGALNE